MLRLLRTFLQEDSSVHHIRVYCLQADSKITLTSSSHQTHSKKEMSHYIPKYLHPKIGRQVSIVSLGRKKKQYSYNQIV